MKITRRQLRQIIREQVGSSDSSTGMDLETSNKMLETSNKINADIQPIIEEYAGLIQEATQNLADGLAEVVRKIKNGEYVSGDPDEVAQVSAEEALEDHLNFINTRLRPEIKFEDIQARKS